MKHLILIGLPGSGKTTVGRRVSQLTGFPFVDLDEAIERREKMPIPQLFSQRGEAYFRKVENEELLVELNREPSVISTGGGIVLSLENRGLLKKNGFVIFLDREIENIMNNLDISHRPTLQGTTLQAMAQVRRPLYLSCADAQVRENGVEEAARHCAELWRNNSDETSHIERP